MSIMIQLTVFVKMYFLPRKDSEILYVVLIEKAENTLGEMFIHMTLYNFFVYVKLDS